MVAWPLAVILVGAMLAATTGVVAASVISMGLISLPIMLRYGYDRRLASGVIAASGTLAQIIPPSLVLIIHCRPVGPQRGRHVQGRLPARPDAHRLLARCWSFMLAIFKPQWVPALPPEARTLRDENGKSGVPSLLVLTAICVAASMYVAKNMAALHTWWPGEAVEHVAWTKPSWCAMCFGVALAFVAASDQQDHRAWACCPRLAERVTFVLIPPLLLIFLVLGTIFLGVATPTEGGAMGALGAIIMAIIRGRLIYQLLQAGPRSPPPSCRALWCSSWWAPPCSA